MAHKIKQRFSLSSSAQRGSTPAKYRRCASLVLYWRGGSLIFENFARHSAISARPIVCSILHYCGGWRTFSQIESHLGQFGRNSIRRTLEQLWRHGMLDQSDRRADPREDAMKAWKDWNPAAGFFHFSTKDMEFAEDPWASIRELQKQAKNRPMPIPVKGYPAAPLTRLSRIQRESEFLRILRERRTWRKYSPKPVAIQDLAGVLEMTFGIQAWAQIPGLGKAAMKTSPSGGSLHPIEAYVVARRVAGLAQGIYHYNAERHALEKLRKGVSRNFMKQALGHQHWLSNAAFLVLMTAVFARTQWKYDYPRVYRAVLLEAGHLCQTFCLVATWLGLAPFCTIALADTKWEQLLGIDGVSESIIYAAGAGVRPLDDMGAHIGRIVARRERNR